MAPILGFIGVALSGSNTSTNAMFGTFQALVGKVLGFPMLLLPTLNSVGAEIGKPIAPQTASVGVSTSKFVRNEGEVIRHNFGWCLVLLGYLVMIGVACYLFLPQHRGVARTLITDAMRDVCMGPPRGGPIVLVLGPQRDCDRTRE